MSFPSSSFLPLSLQAFADGLMVIPKTLAQNSGFDPQDTTVKLQDAFVTSKLPVGLDVSTGKSYNASILVDLSLYVVSIKESPWYPRKRESGITIVSKSNCSIHGG